MKRMERFPSNNLTKKQKLQEESEDIWGDDLDYDLVDKCITQASQQLNCHNASATINDTITSYDNFKHKANVCSTQFLPPPPPPQISRNFSSKQQESQKINSTTYENFKNKANFCSTQSALSMNRNTQFIQQKNDLNPSSSSINTVITKNVSAQEYQQELMQEIKRLEEQNKMLIEKYDTKDGEISILRSQLKQAQKLADSEKMQKLQQLESNQQQWNDKYSTIIKEKDNVKCELDLKQLEIMNLKEKIRELKNNRVNMMDCTSPFVNKDNNFSQTFRSRKSSNSSIPAPMKHVMNQTEIHPCNRVPPVSGLHHPLQNLIPESLFKKIICDQEPAIKLKSVCDSSKLLRHNSIQHENIVNFKVPEINGVTISAECFFTELVLIMKCTKMELNYPNVIPSMNKIILITKDLLLFTLKQLRKVAEHLSNEDIRDMNTHYLYEENVDKNKTYDIFNGTPWCENELGIELRRCLAVLSTLATSALYVVQCLTDQCTVDVRNDHLYSTYSRLLLGNNDTGGINDNNMETRMDVDVEPDSDLPAEIKCDILNIILDTTRIIGKIRRGHQFPGFLAAVLSLLENLLYQKELPPDCYSTIHSIFQQIVFARPSEPVLKYITALLRQMSSHYECVKLLCKNSSPDTFRRGKSCLMFNEGTCTFQILGILLERHKRNVYFIYDVVSFLYDTLPDNCLWIYSQEQKCECLFKVYSTAIELLYELMEDSLSNRHIERRELEVYNSVFQTGLIVINVLTNRSPDLIIGFLRLYSQYLAWIQEMQKNENSLELDTSQVMALEMLLLYISNDGADEETIPLTKDYNSHIIAELQLMD